MPSTDTVPTTGSGAQNPPASSQPTATDPDDVANADALDDPSLPEQHHAGRVGYGPNYRTGPTLEDKISGIKDELKGKLTRNPDLVAHGRDVASGEARRRALAGEDEPNPFESVDEGKEGSKSSEKDDRKDTGPAVPAAAGSAPPAPASTADPIPGKGAQQQAATVAPEGTGAAERQRAGDAQDVKQVDARN
ncbi:hypothetical protein HYPSUDRAFT_217604 [Hypholoma sublateritium FD-334 SS-4]|uniref:Uncharacterized protein n=1 Tax=Hypholoma sublateritium (strain FD-334 SS-4) TaxID=945553 RepID=A0A0D2NS41_HYPSF|nr:hypothetical protein HYPSUDRAFT_217604 [Hypholoma sublateritium FD-334 SS-4]